MNFCLKLEGEDDAEHIEIQWNFSDKLMKAGLIGFLFGECLNEGFGDTMIEL